MTLVTGQQSLVYCSWIVTRTYCSIWHAFSLSIGFKVSTHEQVLSLVCISPFRLTRQPAKGKPEKTNQGVVLCYVKFAVNLRDLVK